MLKSYARMAKRFEPRLELMFERLAQAESLPAIVHCHVGKDRTGFACAMILAALDVPRDEILRDYLATATASDPARLRAAASSFIADMTGVTPPPEVVEPIVAVSEEYLDTAFQATAEQYGSVEDYLTKIGGLTPEKRDRLKALLLE
jgi:protein-tyrosine phosphatase